MVGVGAFGLAAGEDRANSRPRRADQRAQAFGHGDAEAREPVRVQRRELGAQVANQEGRDGRTSAVIGIL